MTPQPVAKELSSVVAIVTDFDDYREQCDTYDGFMRTGIDDRELFEYLQDVYDGNVPQVLSNSELGFPYSNTIVAGDRKIAVLPEVVINELNICKDGLLSCRQSLLTNELVEEVIDSPSKGTTRKISTELGNLIGQNERLVGDGLPEYVVLASYDTSACDDLKRSPPQDITLSNGNYITLDKAKILDKLPELIELHESIFTAQAMQMGYYGGLHKDGIEDIITSPDFIPIAGFDADTGEALMFSLYSPNLKDFSSISWINPKRITEVISTGVENEVIAMPLVITSKAKGLSMFPKTVALAGHGAVYQTQADKIHVFCESSTLSILYTPKILYRSLAKLGFRHQETKIEVTYLVENNNST